MATPISSTSQVTTTYSTYPSGASPVSADEDTGIGSSAINSQDGRTITNDSQSMGKDEFLQLLIAEMKYQDPLDPVSNTESISQLANFSSLEQMQNLNQSFEGLATSIQGNQLSAGAGLIGKTAVAYTESIKNDGTSEEVRLSGEVIGVGISSGETYYTILDDESQEKVKVFESEIISVESRSETSSNSEGTSGSSETNNDSVSETDETNTSEVEKENPQEDENETKEEPA